MYTAGKKRPGGYAHWTNGGVGKPDIERDTYTCFHCGGVVYVEPFQDPTEMGGWCPVCQKLICATCVDRGECRPFEKDLEAMEKADRLRRQILGDYHG
jgi:hypothetical protein